ncbi:hypothetical protein FJTKL_00226 [Diaporthe vaccinii]|uniref:DUF7704 domain-containing protein n=1 Tax=Diaporthe vaccinii TaxID=105482 RepID=A0ABR4E3X1_9PEZI
MAYSTLPTIPLVIFGVAEPFLLVWAYIVNRNDPFEYYADQVPMHNLTREEDFPGQALSVTLQLGNVLLLLAALALVCCFSPSSATAKWYLIAVAFADWGHIYASYRSLDAEVFWHPAQWNGIVAGSIVQRQGSTHIEEPRIYRSPRDEQRDCIVGVEMKPYGSDAQLRNSKLKMRRKSTSACGHRPRRAQL